MDETETVAQPTPVSDRAIRLTDASLPSALRIVANAQNVITKANGFTNDGNTLAAMGLIMTELAEIIQADREGGMGAPAAHLDGFLAAEEEAADVILRLLSWAAENDLRLGEAVLAKLRYNETRPYRHAKRY